MNQDAAIQKQGFSLHSSSDGIGGVIEKSKRLIYKDYISDLGRFPVLRPDGEPAFNADVTVRIFKLSRLVQENRASMLESATALYTALGAAGYAAFLLLHGNGQGEHYLYIGTRCLPEEEKGDAAGKLLEKSFKGHFPGSHLEKLDNNNVRKLMNFSDLLRSNPSTCVSSVTGIPSLSIDERDHFTQGLEKIIDAAGHHAYTALILAEPVSLKTLSRSQSGYEETASILAPLRSLQLSSGVQDSTAVSENVGQSFTRSIGQSLGHTITEGKTETKGRSWGGSVGVGVGAAISIAGVGAGASANVSANFSRNTSVSDSKSSSTSHTKNESFSDGDSVGYGIAETKGTSRQVTVTAQNKTVENLLLKMDHHLKRLDDARSYGGWNTAAYFIGGDTETARSLSSFFLGLMRGEGSGSEDFTITCWGHKPQECSNRNAVLAWLERLTHPRLRPDFSEGTGVSYVTPATLVSGREMALLLSMPRRSTETTTVMTAPVFGRRIQMLDQRGSPGGKRPLLLGTLRHLWQDDENQKVDIDLDKLTSHALVTGTTGVGKTTTIMALLARAHKMGVPFMVIEPAKGEYKKIQGLGTNARPVRYYVAGRNGSDTLRINPLVFPEGIELADHIDRVCTVFNAAFPMYAAMPQILEEAVYRAYENVGWDPITSRSVKGRVFPTLGHVADLIPETVRNLGFSEQVSGDYIGALSARLRALCRGALGKSLLCQKADETPWDDLMTCSSVIDLSPMGSPEKRALLMGVLFMRLYETRLSGGEPQNSALRHLMVLEEAHVLLKKMGTEQSQESSNPRGLAVETFANALAEMRGYGQGFVIADQSASALDDCVLRNTNIKIVMRAPFEADRIALGGALALSEEQTMQLARLENHTAVVLQSDWLEPLLCHVTPEHVPDHIDEHKADNDLEKKRARTDLLSILFADHLSCGVDQTDINIQRLAISVGFNLDDARKLEKYCSTPSPREKSALSIYVQAILPEIREASICFINGRALKNHFMAIIDEKTFFGNGSPQQWGALAKAVHDVWESSIKGCPSRLSN